MNMRSNLQNYRRPTFPAFDVRLPPMSRAAAETRKRIAQLDVQGRATIFGHDWTLEKAPVALTGTRTDTVVTCTVGPNTVHIAVDSDLVDLITDGAGQSYDTTTLKPHQRAMVAEHILSDNLAELEDRFGTSVKIMRVKSEVTYDVPDVQLCLQGTAHDHPPVTLHIWGDAPDDLLAALEQSFPQRQQQDVGDVTVKTAILGPITRLSRTQLGQLSPGAVMVPAAGWAGHDHALYLQVGQSSIAPLNYSDHGGVRVSDQAESFQALLGHHAQGNNMTTSETETAASLADPNIVVTVELSRIDMSVSQLQMIQDGDVLDFDFATVEEVTICTNGKPYAAGKLVQLDDAVGVHITKML